MLQRIGTMKKVKRQPTEWKKILAKQIDLVRDLYAEYIKNENSTRKTHI